MLEDRNSNLSRVMNRSERRRCARDAARKPQVRLSGDPARICIVRGPGVIGPLIMDSFARAFRHLGSETCVLDVSLLEKDPGNFKDQMNRVAAWKPVLALCYGFTGLAPRGFFRSLGVPLALLFYDSPFGLSWQAGQEFIQELLEHRDEYHCFVWDRAYAAPLRQLGLSRVHPIMLAADVSIFQGRVPAYRFNVSFAGRMGDPAELRRIRQRAASPRVNQFVEALIERKLHQPSTPLLELWAKLATADFPELALDWSRPGMGELHLHIHREGSALLRRTLLGAVRSARLDLFGADWDLPGASIHPGVDYVNQLPGLYADSRINVNITAPQLEYAINNRIFDVGATGAFLLTDHREDLGQVFPEFGRMTYHSGEELDAKIAYFLAHEEERRGLAAELQKAVLGRHTYEHRARYILDSVAGKPGQHGLPGPGASGQSI